MLHSELPTNGADAFVEGPPPPRHGASRVIGLLRANLLGGTTLVLLIGAGSGAWAQSVAGGAASGLNALAVGSGAIASSTSGVAVGISAKASGYFATAVGAGAIARANASTAIGEVSYAIGQNSTAVGAASSALGDDATAVGRSATAGVIGDSTAIRGTALGVNSKATASNATALGFNAAAITDSSIALGVDSLAGAPFSLLGQDPPVPATRAVAIGPGASALAQSSVALGDGANVQNVAAGSVAIGANASVQVSNSVALGADSITQAGFVSPGVQFSNSSRKIYTFAGVDQTFVIDNINAIGVVSVGGKLLDSGGYSTRQIQFVAPGRLNADSTDAVNGSQLDATNTALSRILGSNYGKTTAEGIEAGSSLALGIGSVAGVSENSPATDYYATAVGVASKATAPYTTALGYFSQATGQGSSAVGALSYAVSSSTALGYGSRSSDFFSTSVGNTSSAFGQFSSAFGFNSRADGTWATSLGANAYAAAEATAVGRGAQANKVNSVALGVNSVTGEVNASPGITLGAQTYNFSGTQNVAVLSVGGGALEGATVTRQIQFVAPGLLSSTSTDAVNGSQLYATNTALSRILGGNYGVNAGSSSLALGIDSVAGVIGNTTKGYYATAVGVTSRATGQGSTAVGFGSSASMQGAVALGLSSIASALNASSIGTNSRATSSGAAAIGSGSHADGFASIAVGLSSDALGDNAVAIGPSTIASIEGAVALGQSIDAIASSVNQLGARQIAAQKEARGGIAAAVALVNAPMPSQPGKTSWAGNVAKFRDQYAMGFSLAHRLNSNIPLAMTAGVAYTPGTSDVTGRVGMAGEF